MFTLMCAPCSLTRGDCSHPALGLMLLRMTNLELPPTWPEYESIASLAPGAFTLFYPVRSINGHPIIQSASPHSLVSLMPEIPTAGFIACGRGCPQESKEGLQPHSPNWQNHRRQKLCLTGVWVLLTQPSEVDIGTFLAQGHHPSWVGHGSEASRELGCHTPRCPTGP